MSNLDSREELRQVVRAGEPAVDDVLLALRGGPDTPALLRSHARRVNRLFLLDGAEVWGISVFVALDPVGPASVDELLRRRLRTYDQVYLPSAGRLRAAGFGLLPTFSRPHFTVLLEGLDQVPRMLEALGALQRNPYAVGRGGSPS